MRLAPRILAVDDSCRRRAAAAARRANSYLVKPLDLDEFAELVRTVHAFWLQLAQLRNGVAA